MEKSTTIGAIGKALVFFHGKVSKVRKDATNPFFKSKYASLSNILEAIQSPLEEAGLSFTQFPCNENGLTTILLHGESGEFIQETYMMRPTKDDPQGRGSTITYQRRYALAAILGLNIDEDDDANEGSKQAAKKADNGLPWLNRGSVEFTATVKKLKAGTANMAKVREFFKVSKDTETELMNLVNS